VFFCFSHARLQENYPIFINLQGGGVKRGEGIKRTWGGGFIQEYKQHKQQTHTTPL